VRLADHGDDLPGIDDAVTNPRWSPETSDGSANRNLTTSARMGISRAGGARLRTNPGSPRRSYERRPAGSRCRRRPLRDSGSDAAGPLTYGCNAIAMTLVRSDDSAM